MMDKKPKKELVEGIRDFLKDIEEPYDPKEWKRFQRHRRARKRPTIPLFIKLTAAAVCIGFMVYASVRLFPLFNPSKNENKPITAGPPATFAEGKKNFIDTIAIDSLRSAVHRPFVSQTRAAEPSTKKSPSPVLLPKSGRPISSVAGPPDVTVNRSDSAYYQKRPRIGTFQTLVLPTVFHLNKIILPACVSSAKGLQLPASPGLPGKEGTRGKSHVHGAIQAGLNVDLGLSAKGLFYGGGGFVHLPLWEDLSMEVGVNYYRITIGSDSTVDRSDTLSLQQVGIRHTIGMVALPFSLHYRFSKGFSASVGITPFMVVSDRRTDLFQSFKWQQSGLSSDGSPGRLISIHSKVHYADTAYKKNVYIGYIRFSGQVSPSFLRKHNLLIAPYVAIPIGPLQQDKYAWLHGGVSLRMYFARP